MSGSRRSSQTRHSASYAKEADRIDFLKFVTTVKKADCFGSKLVENYAELDHYAKFLPPEDFYFKTRKMAKYKCFDGQTIVEALQLAHPPGHRQVEQRRVWMDRGEATRLAHRLFDAHILTPLDHDDGFGDSKELKYQLYTTAHDAKAENAIFLSKVKPLLDPSLQQPSDPPMYLCNLKTLGSQRVSRVTIAINLAAKTMAISREVTNDGEGHQLFRRVWYWTEEDVRLHFENTPRDIPAPLAKVLKEKCLTGQDLQRLKKDFEQAHEDLGLELREGLKRRLKKEIVDIYKDAEGYKQPVSRGVIDLDKHTSYMMSRLFPIEDKETEEKQTTSQAGWGGIPDWMKITEAEVRLDERQRLRMRSKSVDPTGDDTETENTNPYLVYLNTHPKTATGKRSAELITLLLQGKDHHDEFVSYLVQCGVKLHTEKRHESDVEDTELTLLQVFDTPQAYTVLREYAKAAFCEESLQFLAAIETYSRIPEDQQDSRTATARQIFDQFIAPDASLLVNIDGEATRLIEDVLDHGTPSSILFMDAARTVFKMLARDVFPRFIKSEAYLSFLKDPAVQQEAAFRPRQPSFSAVHLLQNYPEHIKVYVALTQSGLLQPHPTKSRVKAPCVAGSRLVDWLLERDFARDRMQATALGQCLFTSYLLRHVEDAYEFEDISSVYYTCDPRHGDGPSVSLAMPMLLKLPKDLDKARRRCREAEDGDDDMPSTLDMHPKHWQWPHSVLTHHWKGLHVGPLFLKGVMYTCFLAVLVEADKKLILFRSPGSTYPVDIVDLRHAVAISSCDLSQHTVIEEEPIPSGVKEENTRGVLQLSVLWDPSGQQLHVTVCKGAGFPCGPNGTCDAYAKLYLLPDTHKRTKRKTKVKRKTTHPIWNEHFHFPLVAADLKKKCLEVTVWDWHVGSNTPIGSIYFQVAEAPLIGTSQPHWFPLAAPALPTARSQTTPRSRTESKSRLARLFHQPSPDSTANGTPVASTSLAKRSSAKASRRSSVSRALFDRFRGRGSQSNNKPSSTVSAKSSRRSSGHDIMTSDDIAAEVDDLPSDPLLAVSPPPVELEQEQMAKYDKQQSFSILHGSGQNEVTTKPLSVAEMMAHYGDMSHLYDDNIDSESSTRASSICSLATISPLQSPSSVQTSASSKEYCEHFSSSSLLITSPSTTSQRPTHTLHSASEILPNMHSKSHIRFPSLPAFNSHSKFGPTTPGEGAALCHYLRLQTRSRAYLLRFASVEELSRWGGGLTRSGVTLTYRTLSHANPSSVGGWGPIGLRADGQEYASKELQRVADKVKEAMGRKRRGSSQSWDSAPISNLTADDVATAFLQEPLAE